MKWKWYINKENESYITIFGNYFVEHNKNNCKLIIENNEEELCKEINVKSKKEMKIKLKEIRSITNMSCMFYRCSSLSSLSDISNWNTSNVTKISCMFYRCSLLSSLPNISNWNTSNVTKMHVFWMLLIIMIT